MPLMVYEHKFLLLFAYCDCRIWEIIHVRDCGCDSSLMSLGRRSSQLMDSGRSSTSLDPMIQRTTHFPPPHSGLGYE